VIVKYNLPEKPKEAILGAVTDNFITRRNCMSAISTWKPMSKRFAVPCRCEAYRFPHRADSGECNVSGTDPFSRRAQPQFDDARLDDPRRGQK